MSSVRLNVIPLINFASGDSASCFCFHDTDIFVATHGGVIYIHNFPNGFFQPGKIVAKKYLAVELDAVSDKQIRHLGILPELGVLAALCDGCVALLSMTDLSIVHKLVVDGTVTDMCVRAVADGGAGLCALSTPRSGRPQLLVHELVDRSLVLMKTYDLPAPPTRMSWVRSAVCISFQDEYNLIHTTTGIPTLLARGVGDRPLVRALPGGEWLLSVQFKSEARGLFCDTRSKNTRPPLLWSRRPLDVGIQYPFCVALIPDAIEIHNMESSRPLQSIPLSGNLIATNGTLSLASNAQQIFMIRVLGDILDEEDFEWVIEGEDGEYVLQQRINQMLRNRERYLGKTLIFWAQCFSKRYVNALARDADSEAVLTDAINDLRSYATSTLDLLRLSLPRLKDVDSEIILDGIDDALYDVAWESFFDMYTRVNHKKDDLLFQKCKRLVALGLRPGHLGVAQRLSFDTGHADPYEEAVVDLRSVMKVRSPAEQLTVIERSLQVIVRCGTALLSVKSTQAASSSLGADDLLPLFIYVLVRAQLHCITAIVACMTDWAESRSLAHGQLDYCLTTMKMAVNALEETNVDQLLAGQANSTKNYRMTVVVPSTTPTKHRRGTGAVWRKFGLAPSEALVAEYNCSDGLLTRGKLYITSHHVCFDALIFGDHRDVIAMSNIATVVKTKFTMFDNSLEIRTLDGKTHSFVNFFSRDEAYTDIISQARRVSVDLAGSVRLSAAKLKELYTAMRHPDNGVRVSDHRWMLTVKRACFPGQDVVTFITQYLGCARDAAVLIAQDLIDHDGIRSVYDEGSTTFHDSSDLFRFPEIAPEELMLKEN